MREFAAGTFAWMGRCLLLGTVLLGTFSFAVRGASVRFAVLGDYGTDDTNELAVANLVKTNLQPDFIVTAGDNSYLATNAMDAGIGKYYHEYIGNYPGGYGPGASTNRFWPALGNHDYESNGGYQAYLDYFTLPGNERYYDFVAGPVHFFLANSDVNEPDGTSSDSVQGWWLSNRLAMAREPWKLVLIHHEPYSSSGSITRSQWPFGAWGATTVISGHAHNYERLQINGLPYFISGLGGASIQSFGTPLPQSVARYNAAHGAMLVTADEGQITFQFHSVAGGGTLIDSLALTRPQLLIATLAGGTNALSWSTNGADFELEFTTNPGPGNSWSPVPLTRSLQGDRFVVFITAADPIRYFRLRRP